MIFTVVAFCIGSFWASLNRHLLSGNIASQTQSLPLFIEDAYKQYQAEAAFSAAVILALLALVTLVLKEVLESKTGHSKRVS